MSNINGKQLTYAVLHYPIFVPGAGQFGPTLTNQDSGTNKAVKMTVEEPWVLVEVQNKAGVKVTLPIPISSFTHTQLAKE